MKQYIREYLENAIFKILKSRKANLLFFKNSKTNLRELQLGVLIYIYKTSVNFDKINLEIHNLNSSKFQYYTFQTFKVSLSHNLLSDLSVSRLNSKYFT